MCVKLEKISEKHRQPVIDILNYYIANTTSAYREETVEYVHFDNFLESSDVLSSYVINENDKIMGFCALEFYKSISTFQNLGDVMYFLLPEATGKGIGKRVLRQLESDAIEKGITKIVVDISDDNKKSIEFHIKNGFCEYGRLKECWQKHGKKLGIVFMEKELI
jgi:phosphinothricin acetyltransferase